MEASPRLFGAVSRPVTQISFIERAREGGPFLQRNSPEVAGPSHRVKRNETHETHESQRCEQSVIHRSHRLGRNIADEPAEVASSLSSPSPLDARFPFLTGELFLDVGVAPLWGRDRDRGKFAGEDGNLGRRGGERTTRTRPRRRGEPGRRNIPFAPNIPYASKSQSDTSPATTLTSAALSCTPAAPMMWLQV